MTSSTLDADIMPFLISALAKFTKQDKTAIDPDADLVDMGLQSIDAVILSGDVEDKFGIELDPSTVFEHETLRSFGQEIARRSADT